MTTPSRRLGRPRRFETSEERLAARRRGNAVRQARYRRKAAEEANRASTPPGNETVLLYRSKDLSAQHSAKENSPSQQQKSFDDPATVSRKMFRQLNISVHDEGTLSEQESSVSKDHPQQVVGTVAEAELFQEDSLERFSRLNLDEELDSQPGSIRVLEADNLDIQSPIVKDERRSLSTFSGYDTPVKGETTISAANCPSSDSSSSEISPARSPSRKLFSDSACSPVSIDPGIILDEQDSDLDVESVEELIVDEENPGNTRPQSPTIRPAFTTTQISRAVLVQDNPFATESSRDGDAAEAEVAHFLGQNLLSFQGCLEHNDEHSSFHETDHSQRIISLSELFSQFEDVIGDEEVVFPKNEWLDEEVFAETTPSNWCELLAGTTSDHMERMPPKLCLAKSTSGYAAQVTVMFDVDSLVAMPSSLAVCKLGLEINLAPIFSQNITGDLHVRFPKQNIFGEGRTASTGIQHLPHIHFGRLVGPLTLDLFVCFPNLYSSERSTNFLSNNELASFFNDIVFPAIYQSCPADMLQHLPSDFFDAQLRSSAAGIEPRSRHTRTSGRLRLLTYSVQARYLQAIWTSMKNYGQEKGNYHFQDLVLLLDGKNWKNITKESQPDRCFNGFFDMLRATCDLNYLQEKTTWIDYGKETCSNVNGKDNMSGQVSPEPTTLLWRRCCLSSFLAKARLCNRSQQGMLEVVEYPWALTYDSLNMSIAATRSSTFARAGLAYSQFYSSTKEIFDSAKIYPFDNPLLEGLAIDPKLRNAAFAAGGGSKWDEMDVKKSYIHSRTRSLNSLRGSAVKSFGIREEHRVSLKLLAAIGNSLMNKNAQRSSTSAEFLWQDAVNSAPFYVLPTHLSNKFLEYNILRFCLPFEFLLSQLVNQHPGWEQTKLMVMLLRGLKLSYRGANIKKEKAFWIDKKVSQSQAGENTIIKIGMGFESSMRLYGYCWFPIDRLDFSMWRFSPAITKHILFANNALLYSYKRRWKSISSISESHQLVESIGGKLTELSENGQLSVEKLLYASKTLGILCIIQYLREIWAELSPKMAWPLDSNCEQNALEGLLPLSAETLFGYMDPEKIKFSIVKPYNRRKFTTFDKLRYIWEFEDGQKRNHWDNRPYRMLFQKCLDILGPYNNPETRNIAIFRYQLYSSFLEDNWMFPQPINGSFFPQTKTGDKAYQFHNTVFEDWPWIGPYDKKVARAARDESNGADISLPLPNSSKWNCHWDEKFMLGNSTCYRHESEMVEATLQELEQ